ncbi:DEAD/DEAH box helicase [Methylacidiphilum sp. Yel]|uniref:DEAD/DEAH box helicase n=1 Tax=Methylacidiphilum sp. Yel TaxID=1847730 RepID=UPI00106AF92D|nr:DEAD/DEAH box helicase [Methylacidiphilum sp. Yel]
MDVFRLRDRLVKEYSDFVRSFLTVRDERICQLVEDELEQGLLWPEALVQLNPGFEMAETIDELVDQGMLHETCRQIFRIKSEADPYGRPLRLYRHQADAIRVARTGASYVLTSGTGSGKSLAYLVPIVDAVLREGPGKGIRAIVVYPMNALANSQASELRKFLELGFPNGRGPVRFRRYTGQETDAERQEIVKNPPDILLTNYVMLELILTRPIERGLVEAARGLRFLVLDELHTYRGRQGSDVAMLVRRVREACQARELQCVGTSATLAGVEDLSKQRARIAEVATLLFGTEVRRGAVIVETLRRVTDAWDASDPAFRQELRRRVEDGAVPESVDAFRRDPLARWIESALGIEEVGHERRRARPRPIRGEDGLARKLATPTALSEDRCAEAIQRTLLAGCTLRDPETDAPLFAFRVHQFFTRGDTVYASLEPPEARYLTLREQQYVPGDRTRWLIPLVFCRECGQEYYAVREIRDDGGRTVFEPREPWEREEGSAYLYLAPDDPWPEEPEAVLERIPGDWFDASGQLRNSRRDWLPRPVRIGTDGRETPDGSTFLLIRAPLPFCMRCGVSYEGRERRDYARLATVGEGGRATSTTILVAEAIRRLAEDEELPATARNILSFTDNRQDASLQAGHFNDFVEVGLLRAALYRATQQAAAPGIRHDELTQRVFEALALPIEGYARDPSVRFAFREETDRALRDVLGYRLYRDLERGWRLTAPNLEQCDLLRIEYLSLDEVCAAEDIWRGLHPVLTGARPEERQEAARTLLDLLRRELAIKVDYLDPVYQDGLRQRSSQYLAPPWAFDEDERLVSAAVAYPRPRRKEDYGGHLFVSPRSLFGQYLRRPSTFPGNRTQLRLEDTERIIRDLFAALREGGLVAAVDQPLRDVPGYQLLAACMIWKAGDGSRPYQDPLRRVTVRAATGRQANPYFVDLYTGVAGTMVGVEAREHTAQVQAEVREQREKDFREGRLPILFCSPTMELGIDIADLNVVNLRNVPPTPANYAQRSGRAGRSGQPALVFTYCAAKSSHDQYFFRRPEEMVSGQVQPPQLDLTNEDLLRAHVHAVWLAETGVDLRSSLADVLDTEGENPTLQIRPSLRDALARPEARERAHERCRRILRSIRGLEEADWYHPDWLDRVLDGALGAFDQSCNRWRTLYRAALKTREEQNRVIGDASRSPKDRDRAKRLRAEAESQLELLRADVEGARPYQSDFYSYRYFASEGFLPGYNFPRLPLSAFIPGRRGTRGRDEFLSRPRFLAISEFGPRGIVYHEGSRYVIHRVLLPPERTGEGRLVTHTAKQCGACGYLHPILESPGPDLCERCGAVLPAPVERLFRLQNVSTRRRDRISSDEEERLRIGYEIRTGVRFAEENGRPRARSARVVLDGEPLATLTYSGAATLWRINLGWARRSNPDRLGFLLDTERGIWQQHEAKEPTEDEDAATATERVVPFVEDRRNALLFEPASELSEETMASLGAALMKAIQVEFQLEEQELAVEPLPTPERRRLLLFYEAAEGGAGVLRRLVTEPEALPRVARAALALCHFDPETGEDRRRAPRAREDCEAACYDCLMSYTNQPDHRLLDRRLVRDVLMKIARARCEPSPGPGPRADHLEALLRSCQTELERRWLRFLDARGLLLPSRAQVLIQDARARPDFVYDADRVAVFVDGPVHDYPDVAIRDARAAERLEDLGYTVIRFGPNEAAWEEVIDQWPSLFGKPSR